MLSTEHVRNLFPHKSVATCGHTGKRFLSQAIFAVRKLLEVLQIERGRKRLYPDWSGVLGGERG